MAQKEAWDKEYKMQNLLAFNNHPQKDTLRFFKWLKKKQDVLLEDLNVLDLGSGNGRNSNYLAERGANVVGIEISPTAVTLAHEEARIMGVKVNYHCSSFSEAFPVEDNSIDLVLDITSSNSLLEEERDFYMKELDRVLKTGGFMYLRTLCKDGDKNAKELIKSKPGPEKDTYILPKVGIVERAFTEEDLRSRYSSLFDIISLEKSESYTKMDGKPFKRKFWLAYMKKK